MEKEVVVLRCFRGHVTMWPKFLMPCPEKCSALEVDNFSYCREELRLIGYSTFTPAEYPPPEKSKEIPPEAQELILATREDAERVLQFMTDIIKQYDVVSVEDMKELVGLPTTHTDNKLGWRDLSDVRLRQIREGYVIAFPLVEPIG